MMKIGFFHVAAQTDASDKGYACARALVKSVRHVMPIVRIAHFTDLTSPAVKGVDEVRRKPSEPMALLRMRHHACVPGDWLFVDTDVIFQRTVRKVFDSPFDIGVTTRNWPHVKAAAGFTERMPFNMGVVFSRCPAFWTEVYTRLKSDTSINAEWMGDQEVFCQVLAEPWRPYNVKYLRGTQYNFPPMLPEDVVDWSAYESEAAILHYKGSRRKPLMLKRITEAKQCA